MTKMEDSSNLDELNLNFKEAVDQWPHQQERISKTYQKSKSALQEKNN
ncbi:MAG: hypothetical protein VX777_06145 [Chlamydiota bacterium]|nr:hypothetical protein [Chlamydiota bacterium]